MFSKCCNCNSNSNCNWNTNNTNVASEYEDCQSYVPIQVMDRTFIPCVGLKMGTVFPELVSPYMPGQSMCEMEYLKRRNTIGEGCNQC